MTKQSTGSPRPFGPRDDIVTTPQALGRRDDALLVIAKAKPEAIQAVDERDLFMAAVADAKRLPETPKPPSVTARPKPRPVPIKRLEDEALALHESRLSDMTPESLLDSDEALSFTRNGISADVLRKLRRGQWVIQASLDLHGLRSDEARAAFANFLKECAVHEARCVRIIHGKGLGSINREPVLKRKVLSWLQQREDVLAYCQAPAHDGGSGAVRVLLRHSR